MKITNGTKEIFVLFVATFLSTLPCHSSPVLSQPDAQAVRFPNDAAALSALKTKAVDGAVFDLETAKTYAKENPDSKLEVVKSITTDLPHGFAVRQGNDELLKKINDGLKQVIDDGTWKRLHDEFTPDAPIADEFAGK